MDSLDWWVMAGYFGLLLGLSWWVVLKNKDTSQDYFLAGHSLGWFVVGASIFASNIGSEHLVGLAGSGATDGVAMAHYELHAWCLLVLGWLLAPFTCVPACSRCRSSSSAASRRHRGTCCRSFRW